MKILFFLLHLWLVLLSLQMETYLHNLELHLLLVFGVKADENGIKQGGAELDTGLVLFQVSLAQKLQPEMECLIMIPHVLATEAE